MTRAIIAAGHAETAEAAARVLRDGGNAFDGIVAALAAACVAEPVLASLGGGGFLHARPAGGEPVLYDFFTQTPRHKQPTQSLDFYPIIADFGDTHQEFHIGLGAMATPGAVAGLFEIQRTLCRLPAADLLAPAQAMARRGVVINAFQHRITRIVEPILRARPDIFALHASRSDPLQLARPGERIPQPELAAALGDLAERGPELLHGGAWGRRLVADCAAHGGHLSEQDLRTYRVERRKPLAAGYHDATLYFNPPPSVGGPLLGLTLDLLAQRVPDRAGFGHAEHRHWLASAMRLTQELRAEAGINGDPTGLDPALLARYRAAMRDHWTVSRGTTQISIADTHGNLASLTLSNGEGAGYLLPGTGIMMNNMLGEEDLSPGGFHSWPEDSRIGSMMCPTLIAHAHGGWTVTGSSGSNRIRSAILQVLTNLIDLDMPLADAVDAPRIHYENGILNIEPPCDAAVMEVLRRNWPNILAWSERSVFFGGAHSVRLGADGTLEGAGDGRRGGVVERVGH
ncbi:MAG: gamma-glutamyltransferase [Thiohalocapsa sp.]|nr:gamma-glutamyltransferase [Thiohalocapsa sp.]